MLHDQQLLAEIGQPILPIALMNEGDVSIASPAAGSDEGFFSSAMEQTNIYRYPDVRIRSPQAVPSRGRESSRH